MHISRAPTALLHLWARRAAAATADAAAVRCPVRCRCCSDSAIPSSAGDAGRKRLDSEPDRPRLRPDPGTAAGDGPADAEAISGSKHCKQAAVRQPERHWHLQLELQL